jgi:hypothetical protein
MDAARQHRLEDLLQGFGDAFQLKEALKKQNERKKKTFWSDVKLEGSDDHNSPVEEEDAANDEPGDDGSDIDLDDLLDGGEVTAVGTMNPIADFETLVELGKSNKERLRTAVTGMQHQISSFFEGGNSAFFPKAVQCLAHFRQRCVELQYGSEFNEYFAQLKIAVGGDNSVVWTTLQEEGLTLLTMQEDPTLSTTAAQARVFLYGEAKELDLPEASASLSSQVEAMENEDDMFADFE